VRYFSERRNRPQLAATTLTAAVAPTGPDREVVLTPADAEFHYYFAYLPQTSLLPRPRFSPCGRLLDPIEPWRNGATLYRLELTPSERERFEAPHRARFLRESAWAVDHSPTDLVSSIKPDDRPTVLRVRAAMRAAIHAGGETGRAVATDDGAGVGAVAHAAADAAASHPAYRTTMACSSAGSWAPAAALAATVYELCRTRGHDIDAAIAAAAAQIGQRWPAAAVAQPGWAPPYTALAAEIGFSEAWLWAMRAAAVALAPAIFNDVLGSGLGLSHSIQAVVRAFDRSGIRTAVETGCFTTRCSTESYAVVMLRSVVPATYAVVVDAGRRSEEAVAAAFAASKIASTASAMVYIPGREDDYRAAAFAAVYLAALAAGGSLGTTRKAAKLGTMRSTASPSYGDDRVSRPSLVLTTAPRERRPPPSRPFPGLPMGGASRRPRPSSRLPRPATPSSPIHPRRAPRPTTPSGLGHPRRRASVPSAATARRASDGRARVLCQCSAAPSAQFHRACPAHEQTGRGRRRRRHPRTPPGDRGHGGRRRRARGPAAPERRALDGHLCLPPGRRPVRLQPGLPPLARHRQRPRCTDAGWRWVSAATALCRPRPLPALPSPCLRPPNSSRQLWRRLFLARFKLQHGGRRLSYGAGGGLPATPDLRSSWRVGDPAGTPLPARCPPTASRGRLTTNPRTSTSRGGAGLCPQRRRACCGPWAPRWCPRRSGTSTGRPCTRCGTTGRSATPSSPASPYPARRRRRRRCPWTMAPALTAASRPCSARRAAFS